MINDTGCIIHQLRIYEFIHSHNELSTRYTANIHIYILLRLRGAQSIIRSHIKFFNAFVVYWRCIVQYVSLGRHLATVLNNFLHKFKKKNPSFIKCRSDERKAHTLEVSTLYKCEKTVATAAIFWRRRSYRNLTRIDRGGRWEIK